MKNERPIISVIMPAYNAERSIRQALASALAQTCEQIEVIVVDDGSRDATCAIVEEFAGRDRRVRLIRQSNAGVGAARNTGIRQACGTFIAPLDADDTWFPTKLEKQMARMEAGGEKTGMVCCEYEVFDERAGTTNSISYELGDHFRLRRGLIYDNLVGNGSVPLFRKSALDKIGYYMTRAEQSGAQGCEDWCLGIRIAEKYEVRFVPETLVTYRQGESCMSLNAKSMEKSFQYCMKKARQRNPDLPAALFHWSSGSFYRYLSRQSYMGGRYLMSAHYLIQAAFHDPVILMGTMFYRALLKSAIGAVIGSNIRRVCKAVKGARHQPEETGKTRKFSLNAIVGNIQRRRWLSVLNDEIQ